MRLFLPSTRGWRDKGPGAARRAGAGAAVWAQPSGQDTGPILRYCGRSLNAAFCPLPVRLQTHKLHLLFFSQEEKSAFAVKGAGLADRGLSAPQRPAAAPQHQAPPVPPGHRRSPPPLPSRGRAAAVRGEPLASPRESRAAGAAAPGEALFRPAHAGAEPASPGGAAALPPTPRHGGRSPAPRWRGGGALPPRPAQPRPVRAGAGGASAVVGRACALGRGTLASWRGGEAGAVAAAVAAG